MEVILREHVDNVGRRGEVVKVAAGFARNYLLPRKLALAVTDGNRKIIERERKVADAREAEEKQTAEALSARIAETEITIARRVGETEQLYGSVTTADLAEALSAKGSTSTSGRSTSTSRSRRLASSPCRSGCSGT